MNFIKYDSLNKNNLSELEAAAQIHASTPLNWNPTYVVTSERVQYYVDIFLKILDRETVFLYAARNESNKLVGFHWVNLADIEGSKYAKIDSLWVDETYRKNGIGQKLKSAGEQWAKSKGADYIKTAVYFDNKRMIDFNIKQGFKPQQVEMIKKL